MRLGWREWVRLPDLGLPWMKAKLDTGARTSALHAASIEFLERDGEDFVRFEVHPKQGNLEHAITVETKLVDQRHVRSSGGRRSFRPVILTTLEIGGRSLEVEMTLICRKRMKFRMLIGREALRGMFMVDPEESFLSGKKRKTRQLNLGSVRKEDR